MINNNWTKDEFTAYVLIYAAQSNYVETEEESAYILSKVNEKAVEKMHEEIARDNDFQSAEKIQQYLLENSYSQADKENLITEIKEVFFADGSVDILEKNLFLYLKKILN